jgi:hypothetical protein
MADPTTRVGIQEISDFAGISSTIAIGHVLYVFGFPIILENNLWIMARAGHARIFVVPIGGIHLFIGETNPTATIESNLR